MLAQGYQDKLLYVSSFAFHLYFCNVSYSLESIKQHYFFLFQIACCSAIRNIVSRSKHFASDFVELEIEELLNSVRKTHPQSDEFVKAALRDLGLKVEMKEQWKGTGVAMNNDPTATIKDFDLPEGL